LPKYVGNPGPTFNFMEHDLDTVDFMHSAHFVGVTGMFPAGHAILNVRNLYFHVTRLISTPLWMTESQYRFYLSSNGKEEKYRVRVSDVNRPQAAKTRLKNLLHTKWLWLAIPHNCVCFCEDVLHAGGSKAGLFSNLPLHEEARAKQFDKLYWMRPEG
jgi:hypothetical protein